MKTTLLILIIFIIGLILGALMMSLVAAQKTRELERNVAYFKSVYETALNEIKTLRISATQGEEINFNLEERMASTTFNPSKEQKE